MIGIAGNRPTVALAGPTFEPFAATVPDGSEEGASIPNLREPSGDWVGRGSGQAVRVPVC